MHFSRFYTPEDIQAEAPTKLMAHAARHGRAEIEGWRVRKDGTRFWANSVLTALRDENGILRGYAKVTRDLTQRRLFEDQLRRLAEVIPALVAFMTPDERYTFANETYQRWFGIPVLGKTLREVVGDAAYRIIEPHVRKALSGIAAEFEANVPYQNGGARWIHAFYVPSTDSFGKVTGYVSVVQDITERKSAEERFRLIAEASPGIVFTNLPDGTSDYVSPRYFEYTGLSPSSDLESRRARLHPEDLDRTRKQWEDCVCTGKPFDTEYRLRGADGVYRWFVGKCHPLRDASGRVVKWFGVVTDIDRQKRLAESQQFLSEATAILSSSLDYEATLERIARLCVGRLSDWCTVHIQDSEGRVRQVALALRDPAKIAWGRELGLRYPYDPNAPRGIPQVLRSGRSEIYPEIPDEILRASARDEEHYTILKTLGMTSAMVVPMRARDKVIGAISFIACELGRRYGSDDLALAETLAERAAMAIDNARLYRQSQEAIRSREEFLSIASHELKTPLTSLQLHIQGLVRRARKDPKGSIPAQNILETFDQLEQQSRRLAKLVNDLLDVSRITAGRLQLILEPIDLVELVRITGSRFEEAFAARNTGLQVEADGSIMGRWDRLRLEQVLTNLLSNALKYGEGKPVTLRTWAAGERAFISVQDRGLGIKPEFLERIFKPFERGETSVNYGGLGLFISRQIVEAHKGTIEVHSRPGEGSMFTVVLPVRLLPELAESSESTNPA
jgi:PAS domain S-box-containing protein